MKSKNYLLFALAALSILVVSSCNKENPTPEPKITVGAFILNSVNYGSNDANLAFYDAQNKSVTYDVFKNINSGKKLGDTAQDMVIFGSKMYISVYNSQIIFVLDKNGKYIDEIVVKGPNSNLSPRYFTTYSDKLYVTYYEGYLGEIDTTSFEVKRVEVGPNPDQVVSSNNKLYVANSGGMSYPNYGKTVSVVNPSTMEVIKTLDVVDNPQYLEVDSQGDVYLISIGNYTEDAPATLQKINTVTDVVTKVDGISPTYMAMGNDDSLYLITSKYDEKWNVVNGYYVYDAITEKLGGNFITDGTNVPSAYYISTDPVSGDVYIGSSDYVSNGDMYIYTSKGVLVKKFDTGGLNPIGAFFLTK